MPSIPLKYGRSAIDFDFDPKRFEVLVNGRKIAGIEVAAGGEHEFKDYLVGLPEDLGMEKGLTVVFRAVEGSSVPGIYELRLLRK